jgi:Mce-associated membrane protein
VNPSLYDLFDVDPTATADEIRTAWRAKIADLDPTDARFGRLNDAAGVLLDPERRAAYDASLAPAPAPVSRESTVTEHGPNVTLPRSGRLIPSWLLVGLALLTAIIGAGAIALATLVPSSSQLADATSEAEQSAQRAVTTIFSYDYTRLDADQAAADAFLTADYRKKYDDLFELIKQNAPDLKIKVEAQFVSSGLVRTGGGDTGGVFGSLTEGKADRVQVLVMFDQVKTSAGATHAVTFRNFATLTMQKVGSTWLVDGIAGPPRQQ